MEAKDYIIAIDQGTTGTTVLVVNGRGEVASSASIDVRRFFPQPGWVEQDPKELLQSVNLAIHGAMRKAGIDASCVRGTGITNQRETTVVWDRKTGEPVNNAIVWQCRRTAPLCEDLKRRSLDRFIRERTGLVIDAYFSATKLRWILDNIPDGQKRAEAGELLFGTVDTWLAWNLTGGAAHVTDYSNASRTMLFNIFDRDWDAGMLRLLNIPREVLPRVIPSSAACGEVKSGLPGVPVAALAGDQQSALFGQACYEPGMAKNTYGTGSFILLNAGEKPIGREDGLITTIAWGLDNKITYALEGSIFITGAAVQWLRDGLHLINDAAETESLALEVPDNGGVFFVPAFVGLGAPYWDMYARGTMVGLTQGSTRNHIVRATLESIAYQTRDVIEAMVTQANLKVPLLRVDGGGTANAFLMQFQADILGIPIQVAAVPETTALGAAYLAGLATGLWKDTAEIARQWRADRTYEPKMSADERESLYAGWKRAVERSRGWAQ